MNGLTKRPDETQTEFAIRCIKAEAWAEGWTARDPKNAAPMVGDNPYLDEED